MGGREQIRYFIIFYENSGGYLSKKMYLCKQLIHKLFMYRDNRHIIYVNAAQKAAQKFGGLENLYKHTHTHN